MSENQFTDKTITCPDCGEGFLWDVGQQRFYFAKCLMEPRRCPKCRILRRRSIAAAKEKSEEYGV